jgi:hypothetical protein
MPAAVGWAYSGTGLCLTEIQLYAVGPAAPVAQVATSSSHPAPAADDSFIASTQISLEAKQMWPAPLGSPLTVVASVKYAGSFLEIYTLARYPPAYPVAQAAVSLTHCSGTEKTLLQASALLKQKAAQPQPQTHAALDFVFFLQHSNRTQLCTAHAFSSEENA